MSKLRTALIGAGGRGSAVRLPHILLMNDVFELVAICDRDEDKARQVAAKHNVKAYGRVQELVANESLDIAAVSTPGDSHHVICAYLAEHGVNIIVETPLAITLPLCDLIIDAVDRKGVRLSSIRLLSGSEPIRATGISMERPIPRVNASAIRQYTQEDWSMGIIDFANGATGFMAYSEIYHAQAIGRKQTMLFQIDGTTGTIVDNTVYLTTEEQRLNGGRATAYPIKPVMKSVEGGQILERMEIETDPPFVWENPFPQYKVSVGGLAIIEEMDSIAQAIRTDQPTRYDARTGRKDMELQIAVGESGRLGRKPLDLPLTEITPHEEGIHAHFKEKYGADPYDVEKLVDFFFPKV
ncbi:Gfo/Idh/MocA family oxidoreductase [Candidatus Poribacteria bacterium]|nr:Gfo/Idh/MocA family oxidoreductase [Candidatus Poribacteria bacterium]